ncbi:MAG: hypothetical protein ACRDH9_11310 [Actinomycetota bacterium]
MATGERRGEGQTEKRSDKSSLRAAPAIALVASLGLSALVGLVALVSGDLDETGWRVLATTISVAVFTGLGLASVIRLNRGSYVPLGIAGMVTSATGLVLSIVLIWADPAGDGFWRSWASASVSAALAAYASLVLLIRPSNRPVSIVMAISTVSLAVSWGIILIAIWADIADGDSVARLGGAFGILAVFGPLAAPLLNRLLER